MKGFLALVITIGIAAASAPSFAGVVITRKETGPDGEGGTKTETRTLMIQGTKQKSTGGANTMILDVETGTMTMLDSENKTATEMSLREGPAGQMMQGVMGQMMGSLKPTGAKKTIAGYSCAEYTTSGPGPMGGDSTTTQCYSKDAPGAAEVGAFYKRMIAGGKTKGGSLPEGIVLFNEQTVKMTMPPMPNMPPEVAKQMAEAMAKQGPQTFRQEVTSIKSENLPAETFAIPADYTRHKLDLDALMGGKHPKK